MPVIGEALERSGGTLDDVELVAVTQPPGPRRRAPRRPLRCEGARLVAQGAARRGRPSARPRRLAVPRARPGRSSLRLPAGQRRAHAAPRGARPGGLSGSRHHARRCGGRGLRQGRPPARPRLPGRPRASTGWHARATRPHSAFPSPRVGPVSTSRSRASRPRCCTRVRELGDAELEARRADLAASYQRAIVQSARRARPRRDGRDRPRADRSGRRRRCELGAAGRAAARWAAHARAPLELCTDNAAMIASAGRFTQADSGLGDYLELDAHASFGVISACLRPLPSWQSSASLSCSSARLPAPAPPRSGALRRPGRARSSGGARFRPAAG